MGERCNKCKVSYRVGGDTWCIGCSAWETIGLELCGRWSGPPGFRRIADDVALSAARHIRALRSLGAGVSPAPGVPSAGSVKEEKGEEREKEVGPPGLAAKAKAVEPESEYEYSYSEEEIEESKDSQGNAARPVDSRPVLERKPRGESLRKPDRAVAEASNKVKVEREVEEKRVDKRERSGDNRERLGRSEGTTKRSEKKKERKEGSGKRRRRRGGRKHQRVERLAADPFRSVHRKLSTQALEGGGSLDLHR